MVTEQEYPTQGVDWPILQAPAGIESSQTAKGERDRAQICGVPREDLQCPEQLRVHTARREPTAFFVKEPHQLGGCRDELCLQARKERLPSFRGSGNAKNELFPSAPSLWYNPSPLTSCPSNLCRSSPMSVRFTHSRSAVSGCVD